MLHELLIAICQMQLLVSKSGASHVVTCNVTIMASVTKNPHTYLCLMEWGMELGREQIHQSNWKWCMYSEWNRPQEAKTQNDAICYVHHHIVAIIQFFRTRWKASTKSKGWSYNKYRARNGHKETPTMAAEMVEDKLPFMFQVNVRSACVTWTLAAPSVCLMAVKLWPFTWQKRRAHSRYESDRLTFSWGEQRMEGKRNSIRYFSLFRFNKKLFLSQSKYDNIGSLNEGVRLGGDGRGWKWNPQRKVLRCWRHDWEKKKNNNNNSNPSQGQRGRAHANMWGRPGGGGSGCGMWECTWHEGSDRWWKVEEHSHLLPY